MSERKNKRFLRLAQGALLCLAAAGYWYYENVYQPQVGPETRTAGNDSSKQAGPLTFDPSPEARPGSAHDQASSDPVPKARVVSGVESRKDSIPAPLRASSSGAHAQPTIEKVAGYDRLIGTVMIDHRNNDGDSFFVRHGEREFELRIYYADTPEKYLSDRYADQRRRVAEQAREMGNGLSIEETVALGQQAREHVAKLLKGQTFSVFTKWERVYNGERYYGFVLLPDETEWLSEELVENGLARIHTKGASTPDGKSYRQYKQYLESLEAQARSAKLGAWK